jgi:two-component system, NarL family, response regulator LiaR
MVRILWFRLYVYHQKQVCGKIRLMDNPAKESEFVQSNEKIKVLIVDDHALMRDALKVHLENLPDIEIVGEGCDGDEAVKLCSELYPDVVIMDIAMTRLNGLEATRQIKAAYPDISVLVLTVYSDIEHILKILEAGAAGYLTKAILGEKLVHAIRSVAAGESVLSDDIMNKLLNHALRYPATNHEVNITNKLSIREWEVFKLAAKGIGNKQISQELGLNLRTVKGHLASIFSKLNVNSRTEAVIMGLRTGLLNINDIS